MVSVFDGVQYRSPCHIRTAVSNEDALLLFRMAKVCIRTNAIKPIKQTDRGGVQ